MSSELYINTEILNGDISFTNIVNTYIKTGFVGMDDKDIIKMWKNISKLFETLMIQPIIDNNNVNDAMIVACRLSSIEMMKSTTTYQKICCCIVGNVIHLIG